MTGSFFPGPDGDGLVFRHLARIGPGRIIQIGCWPTLFGMRVRAGFTNDLSYHIDWCCGDRDEAISLGYSLALGLLGERVTTQPDRPFEGIPETSRVKPFTHDPDFLLLIGSLRAKPVETLLVPPLFELRNRYNELAIAFLA
jgi:hypothetical protein